MNSKNLTMTALVAVIVLSLAVPAPASAGKNSEVLKDSLVNDNNHLDLMACDIQHGGRSDIVAFQFNRKLMLPRGGPFVITEDLSGWHEHPSLSPDGTQVVWARLEKGIATLWVATTNGKSFEELWMRRKPIPEFEELEVFGRSIPATDPDWGSTGDIVFVLSENNSLWIFDPNSKTAKALGVIGFNPDWSPDGNWISFSNEKGNLGFVSSSGMLSGYEETNYPCTIPTWLPHGYQINCGVDGIYQIDFTTGAVDKIHSTATDVAHDPGGTDLAMIVVDDKLRLAWDKLANDITIGFAGMVRILEEYYIGNPDWWSSERVEYDGTIFTNWLASPRPKALTYRLKRYPFD